MNLSVLPSMNDYNLWADDRQKSIHKLIQFLLETAFQRNYRKRGKDLFEPVIFNKHFTYTFKKACTISEFILGHCQSYRASREWLIDKSTTYRQVETYLEKCKEEMLPDLVINRHIFSFGNGIFNGYANKFVTYEQIESKVDFHTIPHLGISPPHSSKTCNQWPVFLFWRSRVFKQVSWKIVLTVPSMMTLGI